MTQEEKDLLLTDLSARLPYGVMCDRLGIAKKLLSINPNQKFCLELSNGDYVSNGFTLEDVMPYLRPMSSMTEEEKKELNEIIHKWWVKGGSFDMYVEVIDFYNSHHFDYRGFIEKGLALEALEGMYNLN